MKATEKTFDNVSSRNRITSARLETGRIRRRIRQLDAQLVGELTARLQEVDSALIHLREYVSMLNEVRSLKGTD